MKYFMCFVIVVIVVVDARAQTDTIAEIRVHGNYATPAADILGLAGLAVGGAATRERLADAERQLRASGKFDAVEVRRRYRSIDNPSEILVILMVDEREPAVPMWLPIVNKRDGHGITYGGRVTFADLPGPGTRISAPFTWGGERRAAIEIERTIGRSQASPVRLLATLGVQRTINPHFEVPDVRRELRVEAARLVTPWLRAGADARLSHVEFGGRENRIGSAGVHATADTRVDPAFPRNAVHATVGLERVGSVTRLFTDARGYVGMTRFAVLALRAQGSHAAGALPQSEWALAGGSDSIRGYRAGHRAGDSLAAISAELRVPLTSPLDAGRLGVKAFADAGAAWAAGERIGTQQFDRGIGGGVYVSVGAAKASVDVAWPEHGGARLHLKLGIEN